MNIPFASIAAAVLTIAAAATGFAGQSVSSPAPSSTASATQVVGAPRPPVNVQPPVAPVTVSGLFVVRLNDYQFMSCLSFKNVSDKVIQAIRFRFVFTDAFGNKVAQYFGDRMGPFGPGAQVLGLNREIYNAVQREGINAGPDALNCWHNTSAVQVPSVGRVAVDLIEIRYANGPTWINPFRSVPILTQKETQPL